MNTTKLTLSIPKKLLINAKAYSKKTSQPLSQLVSRYFLALSHDLKDVAVSSKVARITGLAKSNKNDEELLSEAFSSKYHLPK